MTVADRLRNLHIKAYEANERRIRALVSTPRRFDRSDLDTYERELNLSIPHDWSFSSPQELRAAIRRFPVVLVGDYHTLRQSQKGFLRVLRAIRSRRLVIGLEFVMARYQRHVDAFLSGDLDEEAFLRRIRYNRSWPSYQVWPNFRPIFEYARLFNLRILALDCEPGECRTVFSRAAFAAWRIAETLRDSPRIAVLIGEAHLAPNHLPSALRSALERMKISRPILTIHQTLDPLYFDLMKRGVEDRVDVVKLAEDRYFVPASPPVVAQHSFLAAVSEEPWAVQPDEPASLKREFAHYVRVLARLIGLPVRGRLAHIAVCGPGCLDLLRRVFEGLPSNQANPKMDEDLFRWIQTQVVEGESICLPEFGVVYLAQLTPTHLGEEAAHFLKATEAGGPIPNDPIDFFYSRVMHEAIGYFGSKIFNPKRKPPTLATLRQSAIQSLDLDSGEIVPDRFFAAMLAAWHRRMARRRSFQRESLDRHVHESGVAKDLADLGPEVIRPLVHMVGYEVGERLYVAFRERQVGTRDLRRLFRSNFEAPGVAFDTFHALALRLRSIRMPARF